MTSGIYAIENTKTGMIYIGGTGDIEQRWKQHESDLRSRRHDNRNLQAAWDEYGPWAFKVTVIETCEREAIAEREQHYLDTYMPLGFSYNIIRHSKYAKRKKPVPQPTGRLHGRDLSEFETIAVRAFRKGGWIRALCLLAAVADTEDEFEDMFQTILKLRENPDLNKQFTKQVSWSHKK